MRPIDPSGRTASTAIQTQLGAARSAFERGDAATALGIADQILKAVPGCLEAQYGKGLALARLGRHPEALAALHQVLLIDPSNVEALTWAAIEGLNAGEPATAENNARRLTSLQPRNPRARFLLTNALCLQGRLEEAQQEIETTLGLAPLEPDYLNAKAQILARLNWTNQAIECYRQLIGLRPAPEVVLELGELLVQEGQVKAALALLSEFKTLLPVGGRTEVLLGRANTEAQEHETAEMHWRAAESLTSNRAQLVLARSTSEISAGRLEVAETLLRDELDRRPDSIEIFPPLATIRRMTVSDLPLVERMEGNWDETRAHPTSKRELAYALGKSFDDLGEYGKAMAYFDHANRLAFELSPASQAFDADAWRAYTDALLGFFTTDRIRSLISQGVETDAPIFIVGMIRSGTTLTEQILSSHSQIRDGGETTFWPDHRGEVFDPLSSSFHQSSGRRLAGRYLELMEVSESSKPFFTEKNPANVMLVSLLHCLFPEARFVHVQRNAVDNLLSIWMTSMSTGLPFLHDRDNLVFAYKQYLRMAKQLEGLLPENRFRTFTYEKLTSEPEPTIEGMLGFLDVPSEPNCFHPENNRRTVHTPSVFQVRQRINQTSQEKWRRYQPWLGAFGELLGE